MNKEVEEAKEWLNKLVKLNKRDNIENSYAEILLNYIQELEETLKRYENELDLDYVDNNFIEKKAVQKLIHKERISAEAQTTYEINEIWKEKIENKIEKLIIVADSGFNSIRFAMSHEDEIERTQKQKDINTMIKILQELLNEEE